MVDQQINPTNGRTELPPREVAQGTADLLARRGDPRRASGKAGAGGLAEAVARLLFPIGLLGVGAAIVLGCVPIALMAMAFTLEAATTLPRAACFGISLAMGLVLAVIVIMAAVAALKSNIRILTARWPNGDATANGLRTRLKKAGAGTTRLTARARGRIPAAGDRIG